MSIEYKVEDVNAVDESIRGLYKQSEDGYVLDTNVIGETLSEVEKLREQNKILLDEKTRKEAESAEQQALRIQAEEEKARKAGDYESLLKSSEEKRLQAENMYKDMIKKNNESKLSNIVSDLANDLCDGVNAKIIKPHISQRLRVNEDGNVSVLDQNNNPTVSTIDDLRNEFSNNGDFKHLIRGTRASGGGSSGGNISSTMVDYSKLSASEMLKQHYSK